MTPPPRDMAALYETHYRPLVRLAALLVRDVTTAEGIVQDSFAALHRRWRSQGTDFALCYLHRSVVRRSRSVVRRGRGAGQPVPPPAPGMLAGGPGAHQHLIPAEPRQSAILSALDALPARQREAMVLRYYADLPEAQIASIMGTSQGAVQGHTAGAMAALRTTLDSLQE